MTTFDVEKFALVAYNKMIADDLRIIFHKKAFISEVLMVDLDEMKDTVSLTFEEILKNREAIDNLFLYMVDVYVDEKRDEDMSSI